MPQMVPINWPFLFMFTIIMILIMNSLIYFSYLYRPKILIKKSF